MLSVLIVGTITNCVNNMALNQFVSVSRNNICQNIILKNDSSAVDITRCQREQQFIVTYRNPADAGRQRLHTDFKDKGYRLVKTCNCSEKLELWEYPVGASPDGDDVKIKSGPAGGSMIQNYVVKNLKDSLEILRPTSEQLTNASPQIDYPKGTVNLAIIDSGVDDANTLLDRTGISHFFINTSDALYCSSRIREGRVGMNILRNRLVVS